MSLPRVGLGARTLLILASATLAAPTRAQAPARLPNEPPPGTSASELNPAAQLPRPAPKDQDIFAPEPPGPCPLADSPVQVTLKSVALRGVTALPAEAFTQVYSGFLGAPQSVSVICTIRDRAARVLFEHGILARVEIPEQRIADGALTLEVIEAKVVNVRVRGDIGPSQAAVERYVEKLRGMAPFDMRKAQRYLLLASDVPGVRVRAAVRPSTSPERGAVDIDVSVSRDGFDLVGGVQNYGSESVGPWGGLVRADMMSATQYGERTSVVLFRTAQNEQWVVQATEEARFGAEGLIGRGSVVFGESRPGGPLKPLGIKSRAFVVGGEAAYPLVRLRRTNLNVASGFEWVDQKTVSLNTRDRLRVFYARADGDLRTAAFGRPVQLDGDISVRKGLSAFGASDRGAGATRIAANPAAWVVRASGGAETLLFSQLIASARVQAQYAKDPLFAYEQMALGNLTVGRGYDSASALGDSGVAGAFELRYGALQVHPKVQAAPFAFYDVGHVRNNAAGGTGLAGKRTLESVGAGVNLRLANRANLALTYAYPLDEIVPGAGRDSRFLVRLTASFN